MKILQVIPSVSMVHGGPSRAIVNMEQALAGRGIAVTTVTTNDDGDNRFLSVPVGVPVETPFATRWYFPRTTLYFKVSVSLGKWLVQNVKSFDVVHAHALFSFAPVAAAMVARQQGVPYVLRPLGVLAQYGLTKHHPFLKRISFSVIERRLMESANAIHFTSASEKAEAETLEVSFRSAVIPLGIELSNKVSERNISTKSAGRFNLLFLSRIDPKKNLEALLHALRLLRNRDADFTLSIAGDGDPTYVAALKSLARELQLDDRVTWLGHIEDEPKRTAMEVASAFVLPSHSENFGLAVAEALAAGLPCLVSREVAISGSIEEAGAGVVTGLTPTEIAQGLERLLTKLRSGTTMSLAAQALARKEFSLDAMGERLETLYRNILMAEPRGRTALAH
jgi:glycosyltransferase involved in cell wall biosynthesis